MRYIKKITINKQITLAPITQLIHVFRTTQLFCISSSAVGLLNRISFNVMSKEGCQRKCLEEGLEELKVTVL